MPSFLSEPGFIFVAGAFCGFALALWLVRAADRESRRPPWR